MLQNCKLPPHKMHFLQKWHKNRIKAQCHKLCHLPPSSAFIDKSTYIDVVPIFRLQRPEKCTKSKKNGIFVLVHFFVPKGVGNLRFKKSRVFYNEHRAVLRHHLGRMLPNFLVYINKTELQNAPGWGKRDHSVQPFLLQSTPQFPHNFLSHNFLMPTPFPSVLLPFLSSKPKFPPFFHSFPQKSNKNQQKIPQCTTYTPLLCKPHHTDPSNHDPCTTQPL